MSQEVSNKGERAIFTFISSQVKSDRKPIAAQKSRLSKELQKQSWFEEGRLLVTMEAEVNPAVYFPLIHYTEFRKPQHVLLKSLVLGDDFMLDQGIYLEVKRVTLNDEESGEDSNQKAVIILGFRSLDSTLGGALEATWKDWTGARVIHRSLAQVFRLSRLSFYRRVEPQNLNLFSYVLWVECSPVTRRNQLLLLDFVQRFRMERMFGYLSVYRQEDSFSTSAVVNGILSDGDVVEENVNI
ncbi:uncharacterized protein LOC143241047 [Tachypleus tridentatus]|uniref:uncharacterized protein LOC143241047 n=1 Tax=Tachypleus tridentatus TaxID=6853 RepID=UPI003FD413B5